MQSQKDCKAYEKLLLLWYNRTKGKLRYGLTLKEEVEKQAKQEHSENQEETQIDIDLTPQEHGRDFKGGYESFKLPGLPKADIDSYIDRVKPHIKTLIEGQLRELKSAKVIITLWLKWKKKTKLAVDVSEEDLQRG